MSIGKIYPSKTLFMTMHVGEASSNDDPPIEYALSTGMNMSPLVHSKKTGKWFSISWDEILELAEAAGINEEEIHGS